MIISTTLNRYLMRFSVCESLGHVRAAGYGACGLNFDGKKSPLDTAPGISTYPLSEIKAAAADNGIDIFQTHAQYFPSVDRYGADYEEAFIDYTCRQLEAADYLGARFMTVHPLQPCHWESDPEPERTRDMNVRVLSAILDKTRGSEVALALENMPADRENIPCSTIKSLLSFIHGVGDPRLTVCFDTGHANVCAAHTSEGDTPEKYVSALGSLISCLHIHDNSAEHDDHALPYVPARGGIKWDKLLTALRKSGYTGTFNSEADFAVKFPDGAFLAAEKFQYDLFCTMTAGWSSKDNTNASF